MKLALIRRCFSAIGGAELYLQRLLSALAQAGHEVHLLTESWNEALPFVKVHAVACAGSRAQKPWRFAQAVGKELGRDHYDCVFSLERTLRQDVYRAGDGVHRVWLQRRREFAPLWRRPFVGRGAFHRAVLELEKQTFDPRNTRHVIVNSEMVRHEVIDHFQFPAERVHLVRNGIEVDRFRRGNRAETRARFGVTADEFLLLFVGSGWERKGLRFMLETVKRWPAGGVRLLVVGKGKKPWNAPSQAIFAGPMPDVENAYAAADLLAFLPIYEPSANVCFEALAAGLPVVTSRQNGAAEVISEPANGSLVDRPSNTSAVVEAIEFWRARPSSRPVPTAIDLSLERNVRETVAVLERAARDACRSPFRSV